MALIDRSTFEAFYRSVNSPWYQQHPIVWIPRSKPPRSTRKIRDCMHRITMEGYALVGPFDGEPVEAIARLLQPMLGIPLLQKSGQRHSEIVAEKNGTHFANTNNTQPQHSDGAYTAKPPRIVCLYCLAQSDTGGDTVLVTLDNLLSGLRLPEHVLSSLTKPDAITIEGMAGTLARPLLTTGDDGRPTCAFPSILQSIHGSHDAIEAYVDALAWMHTPKNQIRLKMAPGDLLVIDNLRTFHGRTSFPLESGRRLQRLIYADPGA